MEYEGIYPAGHEGVMGFGLEASMISSITTTLPAAPALSQVGYCSVPTVRLPENTQAVRAAGTARPLGFVKQRRAPSVSGSLILSNGPNVAQFIQTALRYSPATAIPNANRNGNMPVFALGAGYASTANPAKNDLLLVRYCMMTSLRIALQMEQLAQIQYEAQGLTSQTGTATAPSEAQILAAGGFPYSLQDAYWECDDDGDIIDLAAAVEAGTISIGNGVDLRGVRHPDLDAGDANPLSRAPRSWTAGGETLGLNFGLSSRLPFTPGSLNLRLIANDKSELRFAVSGIELSEQTQSEATAETPFSYGADFLSSQIAVTAVAAPV